jgi:uncharacterized protein YndB with AHSA1/START domain
MSNNLTATASVTINTSLSKAWQALTDPSMIKEYLFGTNAESDWKKGSSLTYSGEWEGKPYLDKGTIIEVIPEKRLHTTYLSGIGGKEDKPENYANVIYELDPEDGHTRVTITRDNIDDEEQLEHMKKNWNMVLSSMRKLLEKDQSPVR